jgi:hypothetical protein
VSRRLEGLPYSVLGTVGGEALQFDDFSVSLEELDRAYEGSLPDAIS